MSIRFHAFPTRNKSSNRLYRTLTTLHLQPKPPQNFNIHLYNTNPVIHSDPHAPFQEPAESLHNPYTLNKTISSCAETRTFPRGTQLHAHAIKMGFCSNLHITTSLVDMYGKCGRNSSAHILFDEMPERNAVTWNALISGYVSTNDGRTAVELFVDMVREGVRVTPFGVSAVLVACAQREDGELGAQVQCVGLKAGLEGNVVVGSSLIDMLAKCGNVEDAGRAFDGLVDKNDVAWTSLIAGYAHNRCPGKAMISIKDMLREGIRANYVTYNSLLSSFCCPDDLIHCRQIHGRVVREGLDSDAYLVTTLVIVYSECGCSSEDLHNVCASVTEWDQIAWNAVIAAFANLGVGDEAFVCFSKMRQAGFEIDFFTFSSVLKALGNISALEEGKQTHALVFKTGYINKLYVQNGLVSMYARCGKIEDSKKVFSSMDEHDVISWNSLLTGCAQHGYGREAIELFEDMRFRCGVRPNTTTFLAALTACSHVGLLERGLEYFDLMKSDEFSVPPRLEHYACVVDLYGRAGLLAESEDFINRMPIEKGPSVYKALLSACRVHGNKEIAVRCARKMVELCPDDPAIYVLLAHVLANEGCWNDAARVRKMMFEKGVRKIPGHSLAMT